MLKNNHGLRDCLIMACCVGALGAFGAFFRWLQMQIARDPDTGLMDPSVLNYIVPLIIIIAAAALLWLVRSLDEYRLSRTEAEEYLAAHKDETEAPDFGKCEYPTGLYEAMRFTSLAYIILAWLIALIMMVGGVLTLADSALDAQRGFYVVISALAVLSGLSFPLVCNAARKRYSPSLVSIFMALPVIMYCLWLIVCYRANSNNPNVWLYAVEVIAVCAVILALLASAGYAFGKPDPKRACFLVFFGAFMCITTLSDSRYMGLELIILATAGMLLLEGWLIVLNRRRLPAGEEPAAPADEAEPEPKEQPEPEEDKTVIEAGDAEDAPEPTIQAPPQKKKTRPSDEDVERIMQEYK